VIIRCIMMFVALFLAAPAANAGIIYDWTGKCAVGCGGTAAVTLYLSDNFVGGTAVSAFNGTSATDVLGLEVYMPSDGTYPSYSASLTAPYYTIFGTAVDPLLLPVMSGTGSGYIFLFGGFLETVFSMVADGSWHFGSGLTQTATCSEALPPEGCIGTSSTWVLRTVPEPATAFLFGLGLVVLAGFRKHRRV
jgi:PEP-CTERM motif